METAAPKKKRRSCIGYKFLEGMSSRHGHAMWKVGVPKLIEKGTKLEICSNGFHWSPSPSEAFGFVETDFVARVRGIGKTITHGHKSASAGMVVTRVAYVGDLVRTYRERLSEVRNRSFLSQATESEQRNKEYMEWNVAREAAETYAVSNFNTLIALRLCTAKGARRSATQIAHRQLTLERELASIRRFRGEDNS